METIKTGPPSNSGEFDKAYNSLSHWAWSDIRIPPELKELIEVYDPRNCLELGCGLGRFSNFAAEKGIKATGVDFSPVAIEKARKRVADKKNKPDFLVGNVTNLENITGQFDISFDIGCFHCLNEENQRKYIKQVYNLLRSGGTLLIWALDHAPGDIKISPGYMSQIFDHHFELVKSKISRRRVAFVASHWYWLERKGKIELPLYINPSRS